MMARVAQRKDGGKVISFQSADGARKFIRLGRIHLRDAEEICAHVAELNTARILNRPMADKTARWLVDLGDILHRKLVAVGLADRRHVFLATLAAFLDEYIAKQAKIVKGSTATVYAHTRRCLVEYFGAEKLLKEITKGDADNWRTWLKTDQGLAESTVRRRCTLARQYFRAAERRKLIEENPFGDMRGIGVQSNEERLYFVPREDAQKVLDACPDAEWRLIFALSRYAGLRCPSEHLRLRWSDIDLARGRMTVHSPKTGHHKGGKSRVVPIFPELRPYVEDARELVQPGGEWVITRYRSSNANLRTQLERIIAKAGLQPWPKLFQNLRSTCETELAKLYPLHVVCKWMGNTQRIAGRHYLQVTDADFERATLAPQQIAPDERKPSQTVLDPVSTTPDADSDCVSLPSAAMACDIPPNVEKWAVQDSNL